MSKIIICKSNDSLLFKFSLLFEDLVGVIDIGLMAIVAPGVGACYEDGPVFTRNKGNDEAEDN